MEQITLLISALLIYFLCLLVYAKGFFLRTVYVVKHQTRSHTSFMKLPLQYMQLYICFSKSLCSHHYRLSTSSSLTWCVQQQSCLCRKFQGTEPNRVQSCPEASNQAETRKSCRLAMVANEEQKFEVIQNLGWSVWSEKSGFTEDIGPWQEYQLCMKDRRDSN